MTARRVEESPRGRSPLDLLTASEYLRTEIAALSLRLNVPGASRARTERQGLLRQLDDFLLPRLRRMDAPLLAVIGGSTGAGKSTLTNSLLGRTVSRSGVLRPTTRSPVLVHHPFDSGAFLSQRVLPGLARVTSEAPEPMQPVDADAPRVTALRLVPDERLAPGLAIVDAPDIDSIVEANRDLATQLLSAADLWIFVTTAARYADAVPWEMLRQAVDRGIAVAVVLDRVPPDVMNDVRVHLATMLSDRGLASSPMFTIPETRIVDGFLPPEMVAPLLAWLTRLARDRRAREVVLRRTLDGAVNSLPVRVRSLAGAADEQTDAHALLQASLDAAFGAARADLDVLLSDGTVLRGEVLARWQEFAGAGEVFRNVDSAVARARDRLSAVFGPGGTATTGLGDALLTGLRAMVRSRLQAAVEQAGRGWREHPAGEALLSSREDLTTVAPDLDDRLERLAADWRAGLVDQVGARLQSLRTASRPAGIGVSGVSVVLELVTLSHSGPRDGADVTAAAAANVARRLLDAIVAGPTARGLVAAAAEDLAAPVDALVETERGRLQVLLDSAGVQRGSGGGLRAAIDAVEGRP